jgi:CDP-diacylglycerol--glycerol-3-phosphate 3-phosphatidyltransferase
MEIFKWLLLISFLSDALDGFVARMLKISSPHGARLDSFADALLFVIAFAGIVRFFPDFVIEQVVPLSIAFVLYFIQLGMAYWKYGKPSAFHTLLSKVAAVGQSTFILWACFFGIEYWLYYIALALSIAETIEEISLILKLKHWRSNIRGFFWLIREESSGKGAKK